MWYRNSEIDTQKYCQNAISKLFIFDIDETLFRTFAKIFVRCTDNSVIELDNQQLNSFDMQSYIVEKQSVNPNITCSFDFSEFKKSKLFVETSKPIEHMIKKLQKIQTNFINKNKICGTDSRIILNTAREDFDNVDLLKSFFASYGIDIAEIHLHRAGEMPGKSSGERKNFLLQNVGPKDRQQENINGKQPSYLDLYDHIEFYDDSIDNLKKFNELKLKYPGKNFIARVVFPHDYVKQTAIVTPENFEAIKSELADALALHKANHPEEQELPENNMQNTN